MKNIELIMPFSESSPELGHVESFGFTDTCSIVKASSFLLLEGSCSCSMYCSFLFTELGYQHHDLKHKDGNPITASVVGLVQ